MRPLLLQGHERALTFLKYNAEGDLLFTCSKDKSICVWSTATGERVGTYEGHTGSIWNLDITKDSQYLVSGSADMYLKVWEVMTGKCVASVRLPGPVHAVAFAEGDSRIVACNDPFGQDVGPNLHVFDFNIEHLANTSIDDKTKARIVIPVGNSPEGKRIKVTRLGWLPLNEGIVAGTDYGALRMYDPETGDMISEHYEHKGAISSLSFNEKKTLLVTSSHDRSAKLWDVKEMKVLRKYTADVPVNAASISPIREHVILGGGQEAMNVTTTAASAGKFETRFHHMVFENELGRVKGHFGPINTLAFHPDGLSFTSGAEDGFLRMHRLDNEYFTLGEEDNLDDPVLSRAMKDGLFQQLETEEAEQLAREAEKLRGGPTPGSTPRVGGGGGDGEDGGSGAVGAGAGGR